MHGMVFSELRKFAEERVGPTAWETICSKANIESPDYDPSLAYPDADALALISAASQITNIPVPALLESFGEFLAPDLIQLYWGAVDPDWKTLEFLESAESAIHTAVRVQNPGAEPPVLRTSRSASNQVEMHYASPRKLCYLAKGLAKGVAKHYGETLVITELGCMLDGAAQCRILFSVS